MRMARSLLYGYFIMPFIALNLLYTDAVASEIKNGVVRQEGNRVVFSYDLEGSEADSAVSLQLTIRGKKYEVKDLHLEGDIGKVRIGKNKNIYWNVLQDFPKGLSGEYSWELTTMHWKIGELTMLDTKTNLMWVRDGNLADKVMNRDDAMHYIQKLNNDQYDGYTDWRLPSKDELETMVRYGKDAGYGDISDRVLSSFFNGIGFNNVKSGFYWSATIYTDKNRNRSYNWTVSMSHGLVSNYYGIGNNFIWPVRAGLEEQSR